ncbi:MAG: hypothetical protein JW726_11245 [Anaerolineales bacterium]|nr:hypothetical protein [Anaerolineales bacterium]
MIVIINGPLGIGKTETSWQLLHMFPHAAMLDGDYLGAVEPFEIYDEQRIAYLYQTIRLLAGWHKQHGYPHLVINYVFERPESLQALISLLDDLDDPVIPFRLTCNEVEMERRVRQRGQMLEQDEAQMIWELQRFRELTSIQEENAKAGNLGIVIDTTHLTSRQAAQAIWEHVHEV